MFNLFISTCMFYVGMLLTILWQPSSNISRNPATQRSAFSTHSLRCIPAVFATIWICNNREVINIHWIMYRHTTILLRMIFIFWQHRRWQTTIAKTNLFSAHNLCISVSLLLDGFLVSIPCIMICSLFSAY